MLIPNSIIIILNYEKNCMVKKEANIPKNTDSTKLPLVQEVNPATNIPIRVGKNISLEEVNNPLIIKMLKDV